MSKLFRFIIVVFIFTAFYLAIFKLYIQRQNVAGVSSKVSSPIAGIIIPHHDLAREYIISTVEKVSKQQQYSTIVVIGPNHFQPDSTNFLTTPEFYNYPIDSKLVTELIQTEYFKADTITCEHDHSLGNPLLYLHHYFPNAKIVPILSPMNFNRDKISKISKIFTNIFPSDTLYVGSVDFSHGKTIIEAMDNNNQSEQSIKNFDYQQIYQYHDDHLDSPATIGLILNTMENIGVTNWQTWKSSDGTFINNNFNSTSTSYLLGAFYR